MFYEVPPIWYSHLGVCEIKYKGRVAFQDLPGEAGEMARKIVEDTFELIESERNDKDEVDFQDVMATLRGQVEQHNIVLLEKGLQPLPHKCSVAWAQSVTKAFHKNVRMIRMR